ncbi:peptidase domain-containing ABC transporter [Synechococcus sp. CS-1328]|uniref:peptidase domain-containing ABC transporter n=1 Tax=Synechococcus sp. CS-1328 TaxID=2847976 RepID=UPI00223B9439|nr:peptidase domain-containing ABC transporter [Synechococcus sp. CS-1328]MCT0224362.1 peptidase domain-containing ABC transporter [Synechococcus sp. CS-1328]
MSTTLTAIEGLLAGFPPFNTWTPDQRSHLAQQLQARRYGLGQVLVHEGSMPEGVWLIVRGQVRSLAHDPARQLRSTIERLEPGSITGWLGLVHGAPREHLRASTELDALFLPADGFHALLRSNPEFGAWLAQQQPAAELHQLLLSLVQRDHSWLPQLEHWPAVRSEACLLSQPPEAPWPTDALASADRLWFCASGAPFAATAEDAETERNASQWLRLIGLPALANQVDPGGALAPVLHGSSDLAQLANTLQPGEYSLAPLPDAERAESGSLGGGALRLRRASGPRDIPLAICEALARYFGVPLNRDNLIDQIEAILQRQSQLNLVNLGQLINGIGLQVMLSEVPLTQLRRVPTPALLLQDGHIGLLDGVDPDGMVRLLEAEIGALKLPAEDLATAGSDRIEILLFQRKPESKDSRFSWGWYLPYLREHRRELIEVLAASFVLNLLMLATPLGMQVLIDQVARTGNFNALISIASLLLLANLVTAFTRGLRSFIFTGVANRVDQATKSTILDQLVRLPQGFFDSRPVGQITFYFTQLDRLREFLIGQSLTTIVDFLFSILYIGILLAINPLLTLVTLSTLPLFVILALVSNPIVEVQLKRSIGHSISTYSYLNEAITGIQTIKSQNAELKTRWEFQNRYARFIGEDFKLRLTTETTGNLAKFINDLNGLLVIGFGIYLVMQNQISLGGFIAFRIIAGYITGPLVKLVSTWQQFKRCNEQLRLVADVVDRTTEQTEEEATNIPMPPLQGHVQITDVTFRFNEDAPRVLHGVTLDVPTGAFVGMVGGSGSGKSTVLKLLPRFYRPESGSVKIDGLDINKVELYSLRRQIGVVPQDSLLFDGTIKDNMLLVKPDATADEIIRAAKIACAHDFIMEMPQGYNSSVGERGAGLSGGQRQRMALARAVLQNPRMLILDEATSALDARTERQVCLNLFEAFRGRTVFFITHRLSTVRPADMIVLMDQGAIMEVGSHNELMDRRGWYYALFQSQNQEGLS